MHSRHRLIKPEDYATLFKDHHKYTIPYEDPEFLMSNDLKQFSKDIFFYEASNPTMVTCGCKTPVDSLFTVGSTCPKCGQVVEAITPLGNKHDRWLVINEALPPILSPSVYIVLSPWFGKYNVLQAGRRGIVSKPLLDILLTPKCEDSLPTEFSGIKTGVTGFYEQFDKILDIMFNVYRKTKKDREKNEEIRTYIKMYRDRIFVRHIPMVDKRSHLVQNIGKKMRVDDISDLVICIILGVSSAYKAHTLGRTAYIDTHMKSCLDNWLKYTEYQLKKKQMRKPGHIRKQLSGSRMHFTLRALITPEILPPDCITIPWTGAVVLLRLELLNLLSSRYGMTLVDAYYKTIVAEFVYDDTINECFKALIQECGHKGLVVLIDRNPSLQHGSIMMVYVVRVNTDVSIKSMSANPIGFFAANMDFDGDQINVAMVPELYVVDDLMAIHPSSILLTSQEIGLSDTMNPGINATILWNTWLNHGTDIFPEDGYR